LYVCGVKKDKDDGFKLTPCFLKMNKTIEYETEIFKLLSDYFKTRKSQFKNSELDHFEDLYKIGILIKTDIEDLYKIDTDSKMLNEVLYNYIELESGAKFTKDIKQSFKVIAEFEKSEKAKNNYTNHINAYSDFNGSL